MFFLYSELILAKVQATSDIQLLDTHYEMHGEGSLTATPSELPLGNRTRITIRSTALNSVSANLSDWNANRRTNYMSRCRTGVHEYDGIRDTSD